MIGLSERVKCPQSADEIKVARDGEKMNLNKSEHTYSQSSWLNFC